MAGLFDMQANLYAASRPDYPPSLFSFLASLTPRHQRAWDVGAGSGQASVALAEHYDTVIATDLSEKQLSFAPKRDNIVYACTAALMSAQELHSIVGGEGSVDLVIVAQALHWFDLYPFYDQVKYVLRKPDGIFAAWCYKVPTVNEAVDRVFGEYYQETQSYWESARRFVDDEYRTVPFPFQSVLHDGRGTGPIRFVSTKQMRVEDFLAFIKSMSVLQSARRRGVELLDENRQNAFRTAWGSADEIRTVTFPLCLRVGTVPLSES